MANERLIDANALLKIYKNWLPQLTAPEDKGDRQGVETCIAVLEDAPPWTLCRWCMGGGDSAARTNGMTLMNVPNVARWLWTTATTAPTVGRRWMEALIMTKREKLALLQQEAIREFMGLNTDVSLVDFISEWLLRNGVIIPVRCKDCKYRGDYLCPMYYEEYIEWDDDGYHEWDLVEHDRTSDDGFCDMGERKNNNE